MADERDRIGRDLHDGVNQSMYAVGLTLEDIASQAPKEPESVQPRLEEVVKDLNQVIGDIRRTSWTCAQQSCRAGGWRKP